MKLREIYAQPGRAYSIEFFPPKTPKGEADLVQELDSFRQLNPDFCSVTYGAGGSTRDKTVDLVKRLHDEFGFEVMCHLTIIDQSRSQVRAVLERLKSDGIENIIALAGDPPQGTTGWSRHPEGFQFAFELVQEAAKLGCFSIAVAGFPEVHPRAVSRDSDLRYLKDKIDSGADVVITQLFFDNDYYYRFVEDLRKLGVKVPIVPGILPIQSASQTRRFTSVCGASIPPRLQTLLSKVENDDVAAVQLGIDYASEQCAGLLKFGAPGIHFFSLNKSGSVRGILRNLSIE